MAQRDHRAEMDFLHEASRLMLEHLEVTCSASQRVKPRAAPEDIRSALKTFTDKASQGGLSQQESLAFFARILELSTVSAHPGFLNQLYGGLSSFGLAGDWLGSLLNMSMATFEISPAATVLESIFFERVRDIIGYPKAKNASRPGATLVPGGSNGNMVALLIARNSLFPMTKEWGPGALPTGSPLCVFVSEDAHYSFGKAVNTLGLGSKHLIPVAVDSRGQMKPEALDVEVKRARERGFTPFFVGATSGTTVRTAFDPISPLGDLCREEGLWLHVDAALGGSLLFSQRARAQWLSGLEKADSMVWDAHKLMNVPLVASILMLRDSERLVPALTGGGEDYLFHGREYSDWDTGTASLQCGRRPDILKVAFAWAMAGESELGAQMDTHLERIQKFGARLGRDSRFELVYPAETLSLCFRVRAPGEDPKSATEVDQLGLRDRLLGEGDFMVNYAQSRDERPFFRLVALNNRAMESDWETFFTKLLSLAGHGDFARLVD